MYVRPHLEYGDVIFHNPRAQLMKLIERVQYKAALIVSGFKGPARINYTMNLVGSCCLTEGGLAVYLSFIKFLIDLVHPICQITFLNEM